MNEENVKETERRNPLCAHSFYSCKKKRVKSEINNCVRDIKGFGFCQFLYLDL